MKKITDSLLKRIVRQSLNESYGLLNEYDITTKTKIGNIPIGTTVTGMILPECPDGGFCYGTLDQAKKDVENLSAGGSSGLIQKYCPSKNVPSRKGKGIAMGKPTYNTSKIQSLSGELWSELTDTGMDPGDIKNGLMGLENFPNFCKSEELFYSYWNQQPTYDPGAGVGSVYNGFEGTNWYGIINDDSDDRDNYFNEIAQLFQNSIDISDEQYPAWVAELNANYKVTKDAADKLAKDEENKKNTQAKIIGGGGEYTKWLQEHPALINKSEIIKTDRGDANLYSLNTNDPIIDQYQYGVLLIVDPTNPSLDGTYDDVRVKKGTDIAVSINPATDKFWQFAISQNDAWRYDDVAWSDAFNPAFGGKLALTTSPDLEDDGKINKSIQTERTKGFRHNLLTEVELKYVKGKLQTGPDVVAIQKKLNISTVGGYGTGTQTAVAEFQTKNGITPVTGDVDETTYKAIMALPDPIVPSATAWTRDLTLKDTGVDVEAIKTKLGISTKGGYDTDTQTAVTNYQKKYTDLNPATGIVDKKTFDHIMANTKLGTPSAFSGKKHNYKKGDWIVVKPNSGNEASQLYENNGYFKILDVPDAYTIIIDADWKGSGYATIGGTTAKIIFGPEAIEGVKTIPTVSNNSSNKKEKGTRSNTSNSSNNSGTNTVDTEKQRKRELRLKETCNTLREIKQYLNNTKGLSMVVNCKWNQEIRNQVMMALTGGTPVTPVTPVDQPQYNVVQPESPTNQFL
jgi:peptidoglycan hydrolase-like protein with peptidoglycan-binding domain